MPPIPAAKHLIFRPAFAVSTLFLVGAGTTYVAYARAAETARSASASHDFGAQAMPYLIAASGAAITLLGATYLLIALSRSRKLEGQLALVSTELEQLKNSRAEDARRSEEIETLLHASHYQLNALMENSPSAIFLKDIDGRYIAVNRRFAEMHRRAREQFVGKSDVDLFPPEVAARLRLSDTRVLSSGRPIELEESLALSDGQHTSIIHKFPILDEAGQVQGLCGIATDITERKRAEAELRESRRQLESLLGQLPGMAFRFVNDGQLTPVYVSRGALSLTGHSARDFVEGLVKFDEIVHPEDRERFRSAITTAVKRRRGFEVEYRIIDRGGRIKWVFERGQGVYDEDGKLLSIEGLAIDITQRKDAEAEKLIVERRLLEGQKLESIGVLAGGIAHDFNNLLTGIIGNANLASIELPPTSRVQQNLKQIEIASQRAAELCQQMLAYAGKGRFMVHRVELGSLVENTVPLLRASISKRAQLKFELSPGLAPVMADPTQMRQIVMNLVLNASEALGETDGEIVITTKQMRPTPEFFAGAVLSPPDYDRDFVVFQVRDTGCGMKPETLEKIFDPFFTTKFAGRGLGLAAVLGIIRSHKGGIKVTSAPGQGSTFTLLFPASTGGQDAPVQRKNTAVPWKQEGLALIIDDEDHVRSVTAGMLHSCGLKTESARDGYEGLDLFRARPHDFDIVVLDMTMPRLSGEETLALLREVRPDVRVLFISGYNRREVVDALAGSGMLSFIQKPFTLEALRDQLKVMLA
jgi:PAS domain S-box-containing protein